MLFVGIHCPLETIMVRRRVHAVHGGWDDDLELDTSLHTPEECAAAIRQRLTIKPPPTAFSRLAVS